MKRLLLAGFAAELLNLFAIATTQGVVAVLPLSANRFTAFSLHSGVAWLLWALYRGFSKNRTPELVILATCLVGARVYFEHGIRLSADSPHYFVQARSLLFDHDLDFTNDYARVKAPKPLAERYPVGTALLAAPFLLLAHVLARAGHLEADGFGYPYETAFGLAGFFFGALGLLAAQRVTARFFSDGLSLLGVLTVWASSFLVWYMVVEPGMPHAASSAWATFGLGYWILKRPLEAKRDWLILGALAGVAALVRWQNVVLFSLPVLDHAVYGVGGCSRKVLLRAPWAFLSFFSCFLPQILFWWVTAGSPLAIPKAGHGVDWEQGTLLEVLFSTNRGLFPWNPVLYLSVLGLVTWLKPSPRLAALFLLGLGLELYVNASVAIWWAGWSFGGRRFDSCILFFVVGACAFFEMLRRRPFLPIAGIAAGLVLWNLGVMRQNRSGEIPPDRLVSFESVSRKNLERFYARFGFPFAAPLNWFFARRYSVSPEKFDRLFGHEGFGNLRLAFDPESEPFTGRGWGPPETDAAGRWFRWSVGNGSTLLIPLKASRDYVLTIEARPFPGTAPNRVWLRINGTLQPERTLAGDTALSWPISSDSLWRGVNEMAFEIERTSRPVSDDRDLGASFYTLTLVARPDAARN